MAQSVAESTSDQVTEAARQASRAATALADALEESLGATRRVVKQGGDTAEELMDDTIKHLQRHPVETVSFAANDCSDFSNSVSMQTSVRWICPLTQSTHGYWPGGARFFDSYCASLRY